MFWVLQASSCAVGFRVINCLVFAQGFQHRILVSFQTVVKEHSKSAAGQTWLSQRNVCTEVCKIRVLDSSGSRTG